jgi:hypothetical protein
MSSNWQWRKLHVAMSTPMKKTPELYAIRKIDQRNAMWSSMVYQIKVSHHNVNKFYSMHSWCTETWGSAVDYHFWNACGKSMGKVFWTCKIPNEKFSDFELYLRGDEELTLFQLKWS